MSVDNIVSWEHAPRFILEMMRGRFSVISTDGWNNDEGTRIFARINGLSVLELGISRVRDYGVFLSMTCVGMADDSDGPFYLWHPAQLPSVLGYDVPLFIPNSSGSGLVWSDGLDPETAEEVVVNKIRQDTDSFFRSLGTAWALDPRAWLQGVERLVAMPNSRKWLRIDSDIYRGELGDLPQKTNGHWCGPKEVLWALVGFAPVLTEVIAIDQRDALHLSQLASVIRLQAMDVNA